MVAMLRLLKISVDSCWYFALALPFTSLLPPWGIWLIGGLPLIYGITLLVRRQNFASHGANQELFKWQCLLLLGGGLLECLIFTPESWQGSLPWACLFLALGVLFLRISRLEGEYQQDKGFWLRNALNLVLVLLIVLLATSKAFLNGVLWLITTIYNYTLAPVLMALARVLAIGAEAFLNFISSIFPRLELDSFSESMVQVPENTEMEGLVPPEAQVAPIFTYLAWGVLIVVVLLIIRFIYSRLVAAAYTGKNSGGAAITKSAIAVSPKGEPFIGGRDDSVRGYYRRFLRLCKRKGIELLPQESSGEIQEKACALWRFQELTPLRELYLSARYGGVPSTKNQASKAREEYHKLKRSSKAEK